MGTLLYNIMDVDDVSINMGKLPLVPKRFKSDLPNVSEVIIMVNVLKFVH